MRWGRSCFSTLKGNGVGTSLSPRSRQRLALAGGLCAALLPGAARAERWELAADARVGGIAILATGGQLGEAPPMDGAPPPRCGNVTSDLGFFAGGTAVALLSTPRYRYQLALGGGYYQFLCTPAQTRPVGGLDFRGEHRLGVRTALSTTLRATVDQFDRSLDLRVGLEQMAPGTSSSSGNPFLVASTGVEIDHSFVGRYGVRAGAAAQTLQLLVPVEGHLSKYSTLGPMVVGELSAALYKDTVRERFEIPLRYQLGHFYPATFQGVPGARDRADVPLSQDVSASFAWELRPSVLWTLRLAGGLAAAYQPNLCVQQGRDEVESDSCSIDRSEPGVRGAAGAPPLEVALSRRATGTFIGEASLVFHDRRRLFELRLARGYEPSAYAGALVLSNRLSGNGRWRVTPDLSFTGTVQLAQLGGSSPARVLDPCDFETAGDPMRPCTPTRLVSPQNRDFLSAQGGLGVDWFLVGPLALFAQLDFGVFAITGKAVLARDEGGLVTSMLRVSGFPENNQSSAIARFSTTIGVRIAARPSQREAELLQTAKPLP